MDLIHAIDIKRNEIANRKQSDRAGLIEPPGNYHSDNMLREVSILLRDIDDLRVVLFIAEQLAERNVLYNAVN